jgi:hypothetical protein
MLVPSALGMIVGLPPSMTAAAELLVPRSIPMIFAMLFTSCLMFSIQVFACHLLGTLRILGP